MSGIVAVPMSDSLKTSLFKPLLHSLSEHQSEKTNVPITQCANLNSICRYV